MPSSQWFKKLSPSARSQYLRNHPRSKFRKSSSASKPKTVGAFVGGKRPKLAVASKAKPKAAATVSAPILKKPAKGATYKKPGK